MATAAKLAFVAPVGVRSLHLRKPVKYVNVQTFQRSNILESGIFSTFATDYTDFHGKNQEICASLCHPWLKMPMLHG